MSSPVTSRSTDGRVHAARLVALPGISFGLCVFAFRGLLSIDSRLFEPNGLLEWSTWPRGLWFPFVVAAAAGLAWRRRAGWLALPQRPGRWLAGLALGASAAAIAWARLTGVVDLLVWSFALAAVSLAAWRRSAAGVRVMALPILFLLLALAPPPRLVNEALWWIQSLSARAATALVQAIGAPVLGESIALSTPTVVFAIVESCAALGVLLVLTAAAVLVRERIAGIGWRSWLLVLLAPAVAVALNLARITMIVLHPPLNELHHLWQWAILLSLGGLALAAIAALLARGSPTVAEHSASSGFEAPLPSALAIAVFAGLSALSLIPASAPRTWEAPAESARSIPVERAGWRSQDVEIDRRFLGFVQFRETIARRYERDGEVVELFVGDAYQRSEWSSPFSPKTILLAFHWVPVPVPIADAGLPAELVRAPDQTALVARERQRRWVAQWRFGDPGIVRQSLRQLFAFDASPFAAPRPRRVVRIAAPVDLEDPDGIASAQAAIARFARDFEAELFGKSS